MGHCMYLKGDLNFSCDMDAERLDFLKSILGEDVRDHPEWKNDKLYYINFMLTEDSKGIERWESLGRLDDVAEQLNLIIRLMREKWPDFGLNGLVVQYGEYEEDLCVIFAKGDEAYCLDIMDVVSAGIMHVNKTGV